MAHPDLIPVRRALLSVSDKTGMVEFATALHKEFNIELISTGGTARVLREAGLPVKDVSDVTGFPEMMDGRVKTLHPMIHGGLLAIRDNPDHAAAMQKHGIAPIDLVCVNLYPFKQTIARPNVSFEEAIENIDIGGPSMIRSAAKNHRFVLVVTSPDRYDKVLGDLREHGGSCCGKHRLKQAQRAFAHTAEYDAAIAGYLQQVVGGGPQTGSGPAKHTGDPASGAVALAAPALSPTRPRFLSHRPPDLEYAAKDLGEYLERLTYYQAVAIEGTEAIAFLVRSDAEPVVAAHIRPDDATSAQRAKAVAAFRTIIDKCLINGRDATVEVDRADGTGNAQYCLVCLLRAEGNVAAVTAVIARCHDLADAARRLDVMRATAMRHVGPMPASGASDALPAEVSLDLQRKATLRYGENPHQQAALYVEADKDIAGTLAAAEQLHGKELSYINLLDADAALNCVREFAGPAACIVKHATPCGAATGDTLARAFEAAYAGDPVAAFGGIVAMNRNVDLPAAEAIVAGQKFLEVIVAPDYDPAALELLKTRWKNARLLRRTTGVPPVSSRASHVRATSISGGYLIQQSDDVGLNEADWKVITNRAPTDAELADLRTAWLICKHVKSNAIVIAKAGGAVGIGGGQVDRVGAARIAIEKAGPRARGAVAASDAFFPFPDGPNLLLSAGVTGMIQPGGSVRDNETIAAANAAGAAMIFTGMRHFRH